VAEIKAMEAACILAEIRMNEFAQALAVEIDNLRRFSKEIQEDSER
jgi:hypothetical protein